MRETLHVSGIGDGYDVAVDPGSLETLGDTVRRVAPVHRAVVVTNDVVATHYLTAARDSLAAAGFDVVDVVIPDGERAKTTATLGLVYDKVLPGGIERGTPLVGLGGGVTTDIAGFAAATLLRGLPYVAVPTSLLAMVDASVGGKTGVNHDAGKNLIGSFHPPASVVIDPETLTTLPRRELSGGLAECVKHDVIRDAHHLATMEAEAERYLAGDVEALSKLVSHNVALKATVVAADPYERGDRVHLNFGHTFAHAFELVTDYAIPHGEAVAIGIACAGRLAVRLGMMTAEDAARVERLLVACGLPVTGVAGTLDDVLAAMRLDKKVRAGRLRFVLPVGLGHATVREDVDPADVEPVVAGVLAG